MRRPAVWQAVCRMFPGGRCSVPSRYPTNKMRWLPMLCAAQPLSLSRSLPGATARIGMQYLEMYVICQDCRPCRAGLNCCVRLLSARGRVGEACRRGQEGLPEPASAHQARDDSQPVICPASQSSAPVWSLSSCVSINPSSWLMPMRAGQGSGCGCRCPRHR